MSSGEPMRLSWMHLAGFLVVSAAVFVLGLASGRLEARKPAQARATDLPATGGRGEAQVRQMSQTESTFITEIPTYPRTTTTEIPAGTAKDAFGFPMRTKTFTTKDPVEQVITWYEDTFAMKGHHVYRVINDAFCAVGAVDTLRKQMYYISITEQGDRRFVAAAWSDGTQTPSKKTELIPLDLGEAQPMMLTGDGKHHEMAVYVVEGMPGEAYAKYGRQLEAKGWRSTEPPGEDVARKLRDRQRCYVMGDRELVMTANVNDGRTVLMCMVSPRAG